MNKKLDALETVEKIKRNIDGLDLITVIPIVDLTPALSETIKKLEKGLIPETYRWTSEKTAFAYNYKNYRKWAKSIFLGAKYYNYTENTAKPANKGECYGEIAKYTRENNYQYLIDKLKEVASFLEKEYGLKIKYKALSNYTSIPEKVLFNYSGLAEIGKNTLLINPELGSYFVVGELITDLDLNFTSTKKLSHTIKKPDFSICGECTRCMDSCPTGAIVAEGTLNVNKCLQFISENLILIDSVTREKWGRRLYGCTTCLDVCPYNTRLKPKPLESVDRIGYIGPEVNLIEILEMDEYKWKKKFSNNQVGIRDRLAIVKNALLAVGNMECVEAKSAVKRYLYNTNEIIRAYSVWAFGKIEKNTRELKRELTRLLKKEKSPVVIREIKNIIG